MNNFFSVRSLVRYLDHRYLFHKRVTNRVTGLKDHLPYTSRSIREKDSLTVESTTSTLSRDNVADKEMEHLFRWSRSSFSLIELIRSVLNTRTQKHYGPCIVHVTRGNGINVEFIVLLTNSSRTTFASSVDIFVNNE